MTNELYNTEKINFKKIRESIAYNVEAIKSTSEEIGRYLTIDEKLRLSVLPEFQDRARQIREEIANLRQQNEEAEGYMSFVSGLLPSYDMNIVSEDGLPQYADIEIVSRRLNVGYSLNVNQLKKYFANDKMTAADFEQQKKTATEEHNTKKSKLKELDSKLKEYIDKNINIKK